MVVSGAPRVDRLLHAWRQGRLRLDVVETEYGVGNPCNLARRVRRASTLSVAAVIYWRSVISSVIKVPRIHVELMQGSLGQACMTIKRMRAQAPAFTLTLENFKSSKLELKQV